MLKILLLEDVLEKAEDIKNELSVWSIQIFHNARAFLNHLHYSHLNSQDQEEGSFLKKIDIFLLDFNLGDGNIVNTNIYQTILARKKADSVMCCISSYPSTLIEELCRAQALDHKRTTAFDVYLKKEAKAIYYFVENYASKREKNATHGESK